MLRGAIALILMFAVAALPAAAAGAARKKAPKTRDVLYVGNNWDGTADVVQPRKFRRLARINIIPDIDERMAEIQSNPERLGYFLAIREQVGEGHDQFVDDMFSSHNGRVLYVSRPSLADVVAINLRTQQDHLAHEGRRATVPTTWRSRPTAGTCSSRPRRPRSST